MFIYCLSSIYLSVCMSWMAFGAVLSDAGCANTTGNIKHH